MEKLQEVQEEEEEEEEEIIIGFDIRQMLMEHTSAR